MSAAAVDKSVGTIYYLGDQYYEESNSLIGRFYTEEGIRFDFNNMPENLASREVLVKPAPPSMHRWARTTLKALNTPS